ncbi:MAG: hypothetical protein JNK54_02650 [Elusimicrobia bacterium]|nr:hypothetical protein [Elusimicrobiota bacterium]
MKKPTGNALVMVVVILAVLMILVPGFVQFITSDTRLTVKANNSTRAFQLAESALERGFQTLTMSTATLALVSSGTAVAGYNFDVTYSEPNVGEYQIRLASQTASTILITGVGRTTADGAVRAVRAEYARLGDLNNSITAEGIVGMGGSTEVEWGSVLSRTGIATSGRNHPRFYSVGSVTPQDGNGSAPPNTDNVQWWSYKTDLPPNPTLDLPYYQVQSQADGATISACGSTFYKVGDSSFKGCKNGGSPQTGTWFVTGNASFKPGSGGNIMEGVLIALGYVEIQGNGGSSRTMTVPVPPKAWKEYGNDWNYYRSNFDGAAPGSYAAAVAADYTASTTKTIDNILFSGLFYAGGGLQFTGSGNSSVYAAAIVQGAPALGSNHTFYFNPDAAVAAKTTNRSIQRISWRDVACTWETGSNAACP